MALVLNNLLLAKGKNQMSEEIKTNSFYAGGWRDKPGYGRFSSNMAKTVKETLQIKGFYVVSQNKTAPWFAGHPDLEGLTTEQKRVINEIMEELPAHDIVALFELALLFFHNQDVLPIGPKQKEGKTEDSPKITKAFIETLKSFVTSLEQKSSAA